MQAMDKEQLEAIDQILDQALEHGFELEVIYWALKIMKEKPTLTPAEAMMLGVTEWIK